MVVIAGMYYCSNRMKLWDRPGRMLPQRLIGHYRTADLIVRVYQAVMREAWKSRRVLIMVTCAFLCSLCFLEIRGANHALLSARVFVFVSLIHCFTQCNCSVS